VLDGACSIHDGCYTDAKNDFDTLKTQVESGANERKKFFRAASLAIAHLEFLVGESNTDVVDEVNTSRYHISVPDIAAQQACEITQPVWKEFLVPSMCEAGCYEHHSQYSPINMQGQEQTTEASIGACQHRCRLVDGCQHFSYQSGGGGCHLQDGDASKVSDENAVSGPPFCVGRLVTGDEGTNVCPDGSSKLTTQAACEVALSELGLTFRYPISNSSYPSGCHGFSMGDSIGGAYLNTGYFNSDAVGSGMAQRRPICLRSQAAQ